MDSYALERDQSWTLLDDDTCWGEAGRPVRLEQAQVATKVSMGGYAFIPTVLWGSVLTQDTDDAYASVEVHYKVTDGNTTVVDWTSTAAARIGDRRWTFSLPAVNTSCPHYCYTRVYQFAVAFTADGETHWDNFGGYGNDYALAADFGGVVPVFRAPPALLEQPVRLSWATWDGSTLQGKVLLRNLAYDKRVTIVYSTDGWATVNELDAWFDQVPMSSELEYWRFSAGLGPADEIAFAVRYEVDGQTWWDNAFGSDYWLDASGGTASVP